MKRILLLVAFGTVFYSLSAQSEQTLFNKASIRGGFGGPFFTYGHAKGYQISGAGGGGGLVFNQAMIGAFGQGEIFTLDRPNAVDPTVALGFGGLWLGYSIPTSKALHGFASVKLGPGRVAVGDGYIWQDPDVDFDYYDDAIFAVAPEVGVELNVFHWMRMTGTVGYRYVSGFAGTEEIGKNDLNSPYFGLGFRFGWFGHRKNKTD